MFTQVLESETVRKLKDILKERFNRDLIIQSMMSVDDQITATSDYRVIDGDLIVPIWVQNRFFATAKVPRIDEFSETEQEAISQLVKLILEPTFFGWYVGNLADNAEALNNYKPTLPLRPVIGIDEEDESSESSYDSSIPRYLFLEARNPNDIAKAALQLHDLTANWASLHLKDITNSETSPQEIADMGNISLIVTDVLNLSPEQRHLVLDLIRMPRREEGPFLVIGCSSTLEELEADEMLPRDLAMIFKNQRLNLDRLPSDKDKRDEIFEMLLGPAALA